MELRASTNTRDCYRAHAHAEYSIGIVDAGSATFHHPGGPHKVKAGTVVLIEPDVLHSCNPLPGQVWSYRMLFVEAAWLHTRLAGIWGLTDQPDGLEFVSRCINDPAVSQIVNALCEPEAGKGSLVSLAPDWTSWLAELTRPGKPRDCLQVPAELVPAMVIMQTDVGSRITVNRLAQACGMDSSRFIRRFQRSCGMTPGAYLRNLRINGARRLLSRGMLLADAANAMGFADQAHKQRAFKAHHAMTPGAFRHADRS